MGKTQQVIWLSHIVDENTPEYAGKKKLSIKPDSCLSKGDPCSTTILSFMNHTNTHVDCPSHFLPDGRAINSYQCDDWVFSKVVLIELEVKPGELIGPNTVNNKLENCKDAELVLIKTGFEQYRNQELYWKNNPVFTPELCDFLKSKFPSFTAIGFDTISLMSPKHHELGIDAHKKFLSNDIRIFEDMRLTEINSHSSIKQVVALPLIVADLDGAPCSIIAWVEG